MLWKHIWHGNMLYGLFFFLSFFFFYLWLCWVFVSVRGLSLIVASGGHSSSRCAGLLLSRPLLLWSTGLRRAGSVIMAHGPSRSAACGIFPDQGSNPCPLHWQADSQPLRHQGSPWSFFLANILIWKIFKHTEKLNKLYREHTYNCYLDAIINILLCLLYNSSIHLSIPVFNCLFLMHFKVRCRH